MAKYEWEGRKNEHGLCITLYDTQDPYTSENYYGPEIGTIQVKGSKVFISCTDTSLSVREQQIKEKIFIREVLKKFGFKEITKSGEYTIKNAEEIIGKRMRVSNEKKSISIFDDIDLIWSYSSINPDTKEIYLVCWSDSMTSDFNMFNLLATAIIKPNNKVCIETFDTGDISSQITLNEKVLSSFEEEFGGKKLIIGRNVLVVDVYKKVVDTYDAVNPEIKEAIDRKDKKPGI